MQLLNYFSLYGWSRGSKLFPDLFSDWWLCEGEVKTKEILKSIGEGTHEILIGVKDSYNQEFVIDGFLVKEKDQLFVACKSSIFSVGNMPFKVNQERYDKLFITYGCLSTACLTRGTKYCIRFKNHKSVYNERQEVSESVVKRITIDIRVSEKSLDKIRA